MPLGSDFVHRDAVAKHGQKGKPGYELLHPGLHMPRTYRTPKQEETLGRIGQLMQAKKKTEAQALLARTVNLTPSDRKFVGEKLSAMRVTVPRGGGKTPKDVTPTDLNPPPLPMAMVPHPDHADAAKEIPIPDGVTTTQVNSWYEAIKKAPNTDSLTVVEEAIDKALADHLHTPLWDDLQDQINQRHRQHFERDRMSVQKWLSKRGIIRKHGNKGAPGYELLHPNSMLRGKRSDKQNARLERFGALLQAGKHQEAQALLDRSLNITPEDRKHVEGQIAAARGGKDGGKPASDPHPHGSAGATAPKTATAAPKVAPQAAAPQTPNQPYPPDPQTPPVQRSVKDVSRMSLSQQLQMADAAMAAIQSAASEEELNVLASDINRMNFPPQILADISAFGSVMRKAMNTRGGVNDLMPNGQSRYERAKAAISKMLDDIRKQARDFLYAKKNAPLRDRHMAMMREERDPNSTPAGKHLSAGGSLSDSPTDGMLFYVENNEGGKNSRFTITAGPGGTTSDVAFVHDNQLGTDHFFKRVLNGEDIPHPNDPSDSISPGIHGDAVNEIMAAQLGNMAFPGMFLDVKYAEDPSGINTPTIMSTHLAEHAKANGTKKFVTDQKNGFYALPPDDSPPVLDKKATPLADPSQALAIHIFDYLIANSDRHPGNIASMDTPKGRVLVPIDNGASFHGGLMTSLQGSEHLDQTMLQPETVPYDKWQKEWSMNFLGGAKGFYIRAEVMAGYKGDTAKMQKDAEAILAKFQKVDPQKIADGILQKNPSMDQYERSHLSGAVSIWANRLKMISPDDVVKVMT